MTQGMSQEKNLLIFKNSAESSDILAKKNSSNSPFDKDMVYGGV